MHCQTTLLESMPWSAASWRSSTAPGVVRPLSDQFEPSCFIPFTTGVNALCGDEFDSTGMLVTSMPAFLAPAASASVERSASGESLVLMNGPCRSLFCFARYLNTPWLVRYVCGFFPTVEQSIIDGITGNDTGAHASGVPSTMAPMSGRPVAAPALSLHPVRSSRPVNSAVAVPTMARSSPHAVMIALRVSLGLRCESMKSTSSLRPATPPLAFTNFAPACAPSTMPLNTLGAIGLSTSAMTATLMVDAVTPISEALDAARRDAAVAGSTPAMTTPTTATSATTLRRMFSTVPPGSFWPGGPY